MYMFHQLNMSKDEETFTVGPDLYGAIGLHCRETSHDALNSSFSRLVSCSDSYLSSMHDTHLILSPGVFSFLIFYGLNLLFWCC